MSVIYVSDQDLNCIYNSLVDVAVQPTFMMSISEKTLLSFVVRVGLCNRLAYQCTYHDDRSSEIVIKMPRIHETDCTVLPLKKCLFKKICGFQPVPVMHQDCDTRPIPAF